MKPPSDKFVKVYGQILDSSIASNYEVRHFFEDMLKLADWRTGIVDMTPEAISRRINLPLEKVLFGLDEIGKPDPMSRSSSHDGRRIIPIDPNRKWGWLIVNYESYRAMRTAEERRETNRLSQATWREKHRRPRKATKTKGEVQSAYQKGERAFVAATDDGASDEEAMAIADREAGNT